MDKRIYDLEERRGLVLSLCQAIHSCKNLDDAAKLIEDLLSEAEAMRLAKRLRIAQLLIKKYTYAEIKAILRVSENTIARVNVWLKHSGQGYKKAIANLKPLATPLRIAYPFGFEELKRRYPLRHGLNHLIDQMMDCNYQHKHDIASRIIRAQKEKAIISKSIKN